MGTASMAAAIACTLGVAALLGSIPWGVIISKLFFGVDVRDHGSGNIGTTNALRTLGKKGGAAVFALDFGKGAASSLVVMAAAALLGGAEAVPQWFHDVLVGTAFVGCIWGHVFSPWLGFKGGKGIAVAFGCMMAAFGPVSGLVNFSVFLVLTLATRYVSLGSVAAALVCPFVSFATFGPNVFANLLCLLGAGTVVWAHRANIRRLLNGTESKLSLGGRKGGEGA
ncbi:glycerol-3-phosphate 1-O-acyltransferase PlsY [Berryella wangjianweii]|uniref:Glycerol-3-phosphate acyltransferase n=1 Tax=Berryella wangjianweii TaxID=2734634 RepID=A0A6M8J0V8_9ACTN|nr:glycerol-3-phosphate 1-O-acyltransferase PlsY [Berryella wangjianweii]QKF06781.1 glycerol-3-phosphate 1-O-acyltransferase PlsY [Berryella wangjianweii]